MKLQINYKHLAAEFVIVFFGVAVALAADEWRQNLVLESEKMEYLERVRQDLQIGAIEMQDYIDRFTPVVNASQYLIELVDNGNEAPDQESFIRNLILSSRLGSNSAELVHDTAFQEMIFAGVFNLIDDMELRQEINMYYRQIEDLNLRRSSIDLRLRDRISEIVGVAPGQLVLDPSRLSKPAEQRLIDEFDTDPTMIREIRRARTSTGGFVTFLENCLNLNSQLQESIALAIDRNS